MKNNYEIYSAKANESGIFETGAFKPKTKNHMLRFKTLHEAEIALRTIRKILLAKVKYGSTSIRDVEPYYGGANGFCYYDGNTLCKECIFEVPAPII